jgi:hypothetical protein
MSEPEILHGGCYDCGGIEQRILESRTCQIEETFRGQKRKVLGSAALCAPCIEKRGLEKRRPVC